MVPSSVDGTSAAVSGCGGGAVVSDGGGGGTGVSGVGGDSGSKRLPHGLLFPASDELVEAHAVHLDDLVPNARDVPVRSAHAAADAFDQDLVVFVDEVDRAVADRERGDLTSVLHELNLDALTQGGVGLLRLDSDLLEDDPLRLRRSLQRV